MATPTSPQPTDLGPQAPPPELATSGVIAATPIGVIGPSSAPGEVAATTALEAGVPASKEEAVEETTPMPPGTGVEGEEVVWEGRYSMLNFLGRAIILGVLAIAWVSLAIYAWGYSDASRPGARILATISGIVLAIGALWLVRRVLLARYGHFYRLTNRRLFVSTGVFIRRRDQMELLKVEDVYTKQSLWQRMLGLGTVVVASKEPRYPVMYLTGVDDPKGVMDLVWHTSRAERDHGTVKVDRV